jgi:hypothetical protein
MSLADPRVAGRRARRGQSNPPRKYKPRTEPGPRDDLPGQLTLFEESQPSVSTMTTTSPPVGSLDFHPLADVFPLLEGEEFDALVADIKAHGLREKIALSCEGKIIDGRNRYLALQQLGIDPGSKYFCHARGADGEPIRDDDHDGVRTYIISANIHRRHLTAEQKRELIAKLIAAQPEKSNRQIAKQANVDKNTVAAVRQEMEGRGEIHHVDKRTDSMGRMQPAQKRNAEPEHDWREHWQGMPAFRMEPLEPCQKIIISFVRWEDVEAFGKLIGQPVTPRTKSFWFPPKPKQSRKDFMYHDGVPDPPLDGRAETKEAMSERKAEEVPTTITPRITRAKVAAQVSYSIRRHLEHVELEAQIEAERETARDRERELQSEVDELRARIAQLEGREAPQSKQLFERAGQQRLPFEWEIGADAACAREAMA